MIEITEILCVQKYVENLKAVIFDLDDTLYSEKDYVKSGFKSIANEYQQITDMESKLWACFENGGKAIDEVLATEGMLTDENKKKCLKIYHFHKPTISLYPGVRDMLVSIKKRGIKLGLITDGRPEGQHAKITALQLDNLFDYIIITDELGGIEYRKPNIKAFVEMRNKMNCSYEEMVYIGDNIKKDFQGPNTLGIKSIYYKNSMGLYH